jgi:hypothetical protein
MLCSLSLSLPPSHSFLLRLECGWRKKNVSRRITDLAPRWGTNTTTEKKNIPKELNEKNQFFYVSQEKSYFFSLSLSLSFARLMSIVLDVLLLCMIIIMLARRTALYNE